MKKVIIVSFSNNGALLSKKIENGLKEYEVDNYAFYKYADNHGLLSFNSSKELVKDKFNNYDYWIFIGAVGIAVREIAPYIKSKIVDPGVICIDELGNFVISLLSGHIGGANEMAKLISELTGATPVVTTATDINNKFALDAWASKNDMYISNLKYAKELSSIILNRDIELISDFKIENKLPSGVVNSCNNNIGIYVSYKTLKPFEKTLYLVPKVLHVGIGCRKGTNLELIETAVREVFEEFNLNIHAVKCICSIDVKKEEEGLIKFAEKLAVPFITYNKDELLELYGEFSRSEFVEKTVGVDCVCERSCVKSSNGILIVKKQIKNAVTVSVAVTDYKLYF